MLNIVYITSTHKEWGYTVYYYIQWFFPPLINRSTLSLQEERLLFTFNHLANTFIQSVVAIEFLKLLFYFS